MEYKEEQKSAIFHDDGNILISASAGSGKTFTMIKRLIRLIVDGKTDLSGVLALTFTEASASDMKEKLREALIKKIRETGDERLTKELGEIPYSDISTIDSFCKRLVKKYFYVAGVSPDFAIADEKVSGEVKNQSLDKTFKDAYERGDEKFLRVVDRYSKKRKDTALREIVQNIYEFISSETNGEKLFNATLNCYSENGFKSVMEEYRKLIVLKLKSIYKRLKIAEDGLCETGYEKSSEFCTSTAEIVNNFISKNSLYEMRTEGFAVPLNFDKKMSEEGLMYKQIAVSCRDELVAIINGINKNVIGKEGDLTVIGALKEHAEVIFSLVREYAENYTAEKSEENILDFADLEKYALKILKNDEVRESVKSHYSYIFVDEYQDVNGIQEDIINLISNDNVYMVGDVKQSIYGFRGCRPDFFEQKFKDMEKNDKKTVRLNYNFRSAENVLKAVNDVFSFCMNEEFYGQSYKDTAMLTPGGIYDSAHKGRAEFHFYQKKKSGGREKEEPRIYDLLKEAEKPYESEDSDTGAVVAKIIFDELTKTYYDPKEEKEKPVKYGDIAVLTRKKDSEDITDLLRALASYGIPVTSGTEESVLDYPEVKLMLSVLRLCDFIYDDVSLVTVLKSPVGNFTDEELTEISLFYTDSEKDLHDVHFYDAYSYYLINGEGKLKEKLNAFNDYLQKLTELSAFMSAHDIMQKVVFEKSIEAFILAERGGDDKLKRLKFLFSMSGGEKRYSVREFISLAENNPKCFKMANGGGDDAVRVMTIHSSKGLEFPVVIVTGLEKNLHADDTGEPVFSDRTYGFATKYFDDSTRTSYENPLRGFIKERLLSNGIKEEMRLMYVALTRAAYSLHMVYVSDKEERQDEFYGAKKFIHYIPLNFPTTYHSEEEFDFIGKKAEIRRVIIGDADEKYTEKMKENFSFIYPHLSDTVLPLKSTVTEAVFGLKEEYYSSKKVFEDTETGTERGTIAHRFLELYDFKSNPSVESASEEFVKNGLMEESDLNKIDLKKLEKTINCGAFDEVKDMRILKEKSFLVNVPANLVLDTDTDTEILVQGKIDFLAVGKTGATIIDYKYSVLDKDALKKKYKKQLDLYAYAVEKALAIKVERKYIINLVSGEKIEIV